MQFNGCFSLHYCLLRTCVDDYILGGPRRLSCYFEQAQFQFMLTRLRYRLDGPDRRTDSFSALYSRLASVPALSCRCMHAFTYVPRLLRFLSLPSLLYLPMQFWLHGQSSAPFIVYLIVHGYSYLVFCLLCMSTIYNPPSLIPMYLLLWLPIVGQSFTIYMHAYLSPQFSVCLYLVCYANTYVVIQLATYIIKSQVASYSVYLAIYMQDLCRFSLLPQQKHL